MLPLRLATGLVSVTVVVEVGAASPYHPYCTVGTSSWDARFPTSRWSEILSAGEGSEDALQELAGRYWKPIYSFIRRSGRQRHEAEDLVQGFFLYVLERGVIAKAREERGRFRSFILACLRHFLSDENDRNQALMRGGGRRAISLDTDSAERVLAIGVDGPPDAYFDRQWALETVNRAVQRLAAALSPKAREAVALAHGDPSISQGDIANRLGMTDDAVAVALHRAREKLRTIVMQEVQSTLGREGEWVEELHYLLQALST